MTTVDLKLSEDIGITLGAEQSLLHLLGVLATRDMPISTGWGFLIGLPSKTRLVIVELEPDPETKWVDQPNSWLTSTVVEQAADQPVTYFTACFRSGPAAVMGTVYEPQGYIHETGLIAGFLPFHTDLSPELKERLAETARGLWGAHWEHIECPRHSEGTW